VLRGSSTNGLGDEVESNADASIVAGLSDIPASIIERSKGVYDPASNTRRTVRVITGRLAVSVGHPTTGAPTPVALLEGDRIKDKVTGRIYALSEKTAVPRALSGQSSLTLDLKDTASA
jgi:hypothetical protein